MQRHPQAWKGMCCSETSWKSQNLRRTQTAATVEGVPQTAKQDFKLFTNNLSWKSISQSIKKMKQLWLELWCEVIAITVICTISYLNHVQHYCIVFYYTNPCFCPLSTHCKCFFFYFLAIKSKSRLFAAWSAASVDIANTPMQTELQHIAWRDPSILNGYHISPSLH